MRLGQQYSVGLAERDEAELGEKTAQISVGFIKHSRFLVKPSFGEIWNQ